MCIYYISSGTDVECLPKPMYNVSFLLVIIVSYKMTIGLIISIKPIKESNLVSKELIYRN